ncbi:TKL protein kinase [Saprolegnia parasitica CBS 223.65]|uniref:TKL protein kinase n=1 Tax=Saprolegnia parasitica (strain CBS 223.65) TaxID=695850 RepID=A0A067CJT7_SAPPC|nr:TKL protein kinase [Saprolegnia parasitica CBS 223.65]KDO30753.1 TKL protein kinase [Saprolegnia parasitica CBS 223.65]|eukprot:XP_012198627.1 TKL protein kinase [Saprolegnia parasitica CBS 223.65]
MAPVAAQPSLASCTLVKIYKTSGLFSSSTFKATDCKSSACTIIYQGLAAFFTSFPDCSFVDSDSNTKIPLYELGNICTGTSIKTTAPSSGSSSGNPWTPTPTSGRGSLSGKTPSSGSASTSSSSSSSSTTIIIVVVAVLVVLAIIGFCCWRNKHKKQQEEAAAMVFASPIGYPTHDYEAANTTTAYSEPTYRPDQAYTYQPELNSVHVYQETAPVHVYDPDAAKQTMQSTGTVTATRTAGSTTGTKTGASSTSVQSDGAGLDMCNLDMHRVNVSDISMIKALAQGAFGEVWLGTLQGSMVAVKKLLNHKRDKNELQKFIYEIALMAKIESKYIVTFIGVAWTRPSDMLLITEYMDGGDLRNLLASTQSFSWPQKVHVALHIAEALMDAKLTDFGVSRETDDATMTAGIGTYRWMAPEVLQDGHYTESADVFSFGVILAELSNEIVPYSDLRNVNGNPYTDTAIMAKVMKGELQPTLSPDCPQWYAELTQRCLALAADDRPTAMQVSFTIKMQLRQMK